jgi:hypothetical protein
MAVPNIFGTATAAIPLSNLDANFATPITLGNTAIQLGNTVTTLNNMTLANVTISSVGTAIPNNLLANSSVTLGNTSVSLGSTATSLGNLTTANVTVTNYIETLNAIGNSSTAQTISLVTGTVQTCTLTGNCTFTMPTAVAGKSFILILSTGAGSFAATFTSVKWPSGTAPTITTTASRWDILTFVSDGTNWYGNSAQAYA